MRGVVILLLSFLSLEAWSATWSITYPRPLTENDSRTEYPVKLISLALEQTGVNFRLVPSDTIMLQDKALKQLAENREINVVWSMTDTDRENRLLPIRIPIFKGLIGWRVFMVRKNDLNKFAAIDTMQGLLKYKPIQGYDWPDTKILQSNGFDVVTSKNYTGLFTMLSQGQGDFLPRSLIEVWRELDDESIGEDIAVESSIGVKYPTAMYLFVNKNNRTLARLLEDGLEKAIANGQFDQLFQQQFEGDFNRAQMDKRFFFELDNPLLPPDTPIERQELWH